MTCLVLSNVFSQNELAELVRWCDTELPEPGLISYPAIQSVTDTVVQAYARRLEELSRPLLQALGGQSLRLEKIWLQRTDCSSSSEFDENASPFVAHIDVYRRWKSMLYLDSVSVEEGPFESSFLPPRDFESGRAEVASLVRKGASPQVAFSEVLPDMKGIELQPVPGAAGDILFFDTNTPHRAGQVAYGHQRKTLRLDFLPPTELLVHRVRSRVGALRARRRSLR